MTTRVALSEPLADLCNRSCSRCSQDRGDGCPTPPDAPADVQPLAIRRRWVSLPLPRCERCEFLLLMQAIEHLIPAEELPNWLKEPNADLNGRSPAQCIESGVYEPVFTALFLLDPCGPVS